MRTTRLYPIYNNKQKIRVVINGVHIYTTVADTQYIFGVTEHRQAVEYCLSEMSDQGGHIRGIATRRNQVDVQVDICD